MELVVGVNSYMSLDEVEDLIKRLFLSTNKVRTMWNNLPPEDKGVLIYKATLEIDKEGLGYFGKKVSTYQVMQFPRLRNNRLWECPYELKLAIIELAFAELEVTGSQEAELLKNGVKSFADGGGGKVEFSDKAVNSDMYEVRLKSIFKKYLNNISQICF